MGASDRPQPVSEADRRYMRNHGYAAWRAWRADSPGAPDAAEAAPDDAQRQSYVVTYEGLGREEAEYAFELDERRHRLEGYVATDRKWEQEKGARGVMAWLTESLKSRYWGPLFSQPPRFVSLNRPGRLTVTYVLESHTQVESPSEEP